MQILSIFATMTTNIKNFNKRLKGYTCNIKNKCVEEIDYLLVMELLEEDGVRDGDSVLTFFTTSTFSSLSTLRFTPGISQTMFTFYTDRNVTRGYNAFNISVINPGQNCLLNIIPTEFQLTCVCKYP